ncbi:ABC transporter ATP-binding protein [soil metagenome]
MLTFDARLAERGLDVSFEIATGETVAFLGPNGAGKSTVLALIAGLLRADARGPDVGEARPRPSSAILDGRTLFDADRFAPPHARRVSLLAQESLLFPHLSVLENVAFGPRSAGVSSAEARKTAREWLAKVGALEFAERRPTQLSGGQSQRIAVARALAARPGLLLLDEPMAALDVSVAPAIRGLLRRVLEDRTAIIVTHDVLDAYTLADRVFVFDGGRIVERGTTTEIFERPRTPFAAELAGLNLITGIRTEDGLVTEDGIELRGRMVGAVSLGAVSLGSVSLGSVSLGAAVCATVRPSAVSVLTDGGEAGTSNLVRSTVDEVASRGDVIRISAGSLSADVAPRTVAGLTLAPGSTVALRFAPDDLTIYPR